MNIQKTLLYLIILPLAAGVLYAQTSLPIAQNANLIPHRLTLQKAEELLIQRNLAVTAAKFQIDANRAAKLIAGFRPNPTLTIGAEQFNLSGRLFKNIARTDSNSAAASTYTVRYDQLIERGNKRLLRTELADFQLQASEAQMLDAVRQQLLQLRQAFTSAALARENLLLAEETQNQYEQTIKLTEAKVENGDLAGVELYRVQAASLQYQQAVLQARTSYQQATRDVLNLLGASAVDVRPGTQVASADKKQDDSTPHIIKASYQPDKNSDTESENNATQLLTLTDAPLEIVFQLNDRPVNQSLEALRQSALANRPDVKVAQNLLDAATKGIALAQSQRVRDISVGTEFQRIGSDHTFGVNVSIPLFVNNKGLAAISQAEAQKQAAAALVRQAELQAIADVEKAYLAYQSARRTLDIYNANTLGRAEKLKSIAAFSYKEGAINLLELLDAQRTYNQSITAYQQARADYQSALWQLEAAVGGSLP